MHARSALAGFVGALAAIGLLMGACSDDDDSRIAGRDDQQPQETADNSGSVSNSSVAPDTFLTFEGGRYRLQSLEQANLSGSDGDYEEIGTATEADIDQVDLTVYRRVGDTEAVYTYAAGQGDVEGATPAFWYRWVREP